MAKSERKCLFCNTLFLAENKYINRGDAKFCSRSCGVKHRAQENTKPNTDCSWCNKKFYLQPNKKTKTRSKSGLFFCCSEHKNLAQKNGMFRTSHYNGGITIYRNKVINKKSKCNRCSFQGKYSDSLDVHHKDRNRYNNNLENLEILCKNCHYEEHRDELMVINKMKLGTKSKIKWPPLEKLKEMVNRSSYVAVSKDLGVSDTAVKMHIWKRDPDFKKS